MTTGWVMGGRFVVGEIVTVPPAMKLKAIVSVPASALAALIASRNVQPGETSHVPSFVSALSLTVNVAAVAGPADSSANASARSAIPGRTGSIERRRYPRARFPVYRPFVREKCASWQSMLCSSRPPWPQNACCAWRPAIR